jgi:hypothetical protein
MQKYENLMSNGASVANSGMCSARERQQRQRCGSICVLLLSACTIMPMERAVYTRFMYIRCRPLQRVGWVREARATEKRMRKEEKKVPSIHPASTVAPSSGLELLDLLILCRTFYHRGKSTCSGLIMQQGGIDDIDVSGPAPICV